MATLKVGHLGEYIREQRNTAQISLRQLAASAGVSNPYLSQIERGLRKPSAEILQQIAKALRISAEALYVQAGILEDRGPGSELAAAILADATISERQKQVLLEVYESFRRENALEGAAPMAAEPAEPKPARRRTSPASRKQAGPAAGSPAATRARSASSTSRTSTSSRERKQQA